MGDGFARKEQRDVHERALSRIVVDVHWKKNILFHGRRCDNELGQDPRHAHCDGELRNAIAWSHGNHCNSQALRT